MAEDTNTMVVKRTIEVTPALMWEAWTTPGQVVKWWGPSGFTSTIEEMDVRPGGLWKLTMHGPDGRDYPNKATYEEVKKPEKIVFRQHESRELDLAEWRQEISFDADGAHTTVTMISRFPSSEEMAKHLEKFSALEGAQQTLERLSEHLDKLAQAAETNQHQPVQETLRRQEPAFREQLDEKDHGDSAQL